MIYDQDLPKFSWAEATMMVVYIQNRSLHRILESMTLKEAFLGKKPNANHLLIFGFPAYIHIPKDKIKKLDATSMKVCFLVISFHQRLIEFT